MRQSEEILFLRIGEVVVHEVANDGGDGLLEDFLVYRFAFPFTHFEVLFVDFYLLCYFLYLWLQSIRTGRPIGVKANVRKSRVVCYCSTFLVSKINMIVTAERIGI